MKDLGSGRKWRAILTIPHVAVGHNQWYHFEIAAPLLLVYFSWDWDVHSGYGILTHGHVRTQKVTGAVAAEHEAAVAREASRAWVPVHFRLARCEVQRRCLPKALASACEFELEPPKVVGPLGLEIHAPHLGERVMEPGPVTPNGCVAASVLRKRGALTGALQDDGEQAMRAERDLVSFQVSHVLKTDSGR